MVTRPFRTSWQLFSVPPPRLPCPDDQDVSTRHDGRTSKDGYEFSTSRRHWAGHLLIGSSSVTFMTMIASPIGSSAATAEVVSKPITTNTAALETTTTTTTSSRVREINDPKTYRALIYEPSTPSNKRNPLTKPPPLIIVLHGAANNMEPDVYKAMGSVVGEHAGLPMQLLASNTAPSELADNFCVAAPYAYGQRSFYDDSREKLLQFVQYLASDGGGSSSSSSSSKSNSQTNQRQLPLVFDPSRIFLFGFSDGATVAVELATSRRFRGVVVASYGFTGKQLPPMALQRLQGIGFWVWHAADDVIFDVGNSDRLVAALRDTNDIPAEESSVDDDEGLIRYTRYGSDPLPGNMGIRVDPSMRGHTMGIVAAQSPDLYKWMLSL